MKHKKIKKLISSYVDGEATEKERIEIEGHIKLCRDCKIFTDHIHQMKEGINALSDIEIATGFAAHVRHVVDQQEELSDRWIGIERLARNTVFGIAFAILVLFFITDYTNENLPAISDILLNGTGNDSAAAQVLLKPGDLSKNDLLYAVMVK